MLMQRHFYSPGFQGIINLITDNCAQCQSLKTLPKVLKEFTTTPLGNLGTKFSTDVMQRNSQNFLVTVEDLSSFTWVDEIEDQTANSIRGKLLNQILPVTPEQGAIIRTDGASSFQTLAAEANTPGTIWAKHSIIIEIGDRMNVNKNPVAENKIKEVHKEFLRHSPEGGKLTPVQVTEVAKTLNARIRSAGLASREILLSRSLFNNQMVNLKDAKLSENKTEQREYNNSAAIKHQKKTGAEEADKHDFQIGDLVFLRTKGEKTKSRDQFIIHSLDPGKNLAMVRKAQSQLQAKTYPVDLSLLIPLNYFRPGPQLSADMSKTEQPEGETETSKENKKEGEDHEKKKKTKKTKKNERNENKASYSENAALASGKKKGAPIVLNAAGRPLRSAAAQAYKAWIQSVSCNDDLIKPPWLQEDQPDEEDIIIADPRYRYKLDLAFMIEARSQRGILLEDEEVEHEAAQADITPQSTPPSSPRTPDVPNLSESDEDWADTGSGQQPASPEAASNPETHRIVSAKPGQDKSQQHSQLSSDALEALDSDNLNTPTLLLPSAVSEPQTLELPSRPLQQVQLGAHAPAQDLTAALAAIAVGPPLPPRRQPPEAEQEEAVRRNARHKGKQKPDYVSLHKFGKGGR